MAKKLGNMANTVSEIQKEDRIQRVAVMKMKRCLAVMLLDMYF